MNSILFRAALTDMFKSGVFIYLFISTVTNRIEFALRRPRNNSFPFLYFSDGTADGKKTEKMHVLILNVRRVGMTWNLYNVSRFWYKYLIRLFHTSNFIHYNITNTKFVCTESVLVKVFVFYARTTVNTLNWIIS